EEKAEEKKGEAKKEAKLDINAVPENARRVEFTTEEGTWMSLDVSPDGRTILFDLLGDLYRVGIGGGGGGRPPPRPPPPPPPPLRAGLRLRAAILAGRAADRLLQRSRRQHESLADERGRIAAPRPDGGEGRHPVLSVVDARRSVRPGAPGGPLQGGHPAGRDL